MIGGAESGGSWPGSRLPRLLAWVSYALSLTPSLGTKPRVQASSSQLPVLITHVSNHCDENVTRQGWTQEPKRARSVSRAGLTSWAPGQSCKGRRDRDPGTGLSQRLRTVQPSIGAARASRERIPEGQSWQPAGAKRTPGRTHPPWSSSSSPVCRPTCPGKIRPSSSWGPAGWAIVVARRTYGSARHPPPAGEWPGGRGRGFPAPAC